MQANNYNVELSTDGILEKGMDTLELTLLSRRQHFEELEDFGAPNASEIAPVERKRKQVRWAFCLGGNNLFGNRGTFFFMFKSRPVLASLCFVGKGWHFAA